MHCHCWAFNFRKAQSLLLFCALNNFIIIKLMTSNTCWISLTICFFSLPSINLFFILCEIEGKFPSKRKENIILFAEIFRIENLYMLWYFNFTLLSSEWCGISSMQARLNVNKFNPFDLFNYALNTKKIENIWFSWPFLI